MTRERYEIFLQYLLQLEEEEEEEELEDKFDISVSVKDPEKIGGTLVMKKKPSCSPFYS